jgi:hypothetical protein
VQIACVLSGGDPVNAGAEHAVLPDPLAAGQPEELAFVEAALDAEVDVLEDGGVPEAGEVEQPRQAAVLAADLLALQEQRQPPGG